MSVDTNLDLHFMRIFNMVRDGATDDEIRMTAQFCGVPEWLVLRIGHDIRSLTPEQEARYQGHLKTLVTKDDNA